jgi:hypothetical protein
MNLTSKMILVGAVGVVSILASHNSSAATDSEWNSRPAWAANENSNYQSNTRRNYDLGGRSTSPFAPGSHNVALDLGQVFLMADLGSRYADNIGFQAHYNYGVSDLFAFDASMGYSSHSDGKYSMFTLLSGMRTNLSWYDKVIPYLVFGLGFYKPAFELGSLGTSNYGSISPILFGIHLGPGVDLELTKQFFFGASLTFHDVFGGKRLASNGDSVDVGGTYTTFFLRVGTTF